MIRLGTVVTRLVDHLRGGLPTMPEPPVLTKPIYRDPVLRWQQGEWLVIADEYSMEEMVEPHLTDGGDVIMKEARHLRRREKIMYRGKDREQANQTLVQLEEAASAARFNRKTAD